MRMENKIGPEKERKQPLISYVAPFYRYELRFEMSISILSKSYLLHFFVTWSFLSSIYIFLAMSTLEVSLTSDNGPETLWPDSLLKLLDTQKEPPLAEAKG